MTDEHHLMPFLCVASHQFVKAPDERTCGVGNLETAPAGLLPNGWGHTMSTEKDRRARGCLVEGSDWDGSAASEGIHDLRVVNELTQDV
jgi:hypothetical protein